MRFSCICLLSVAMISMNCYSYNTIASGSSAANYKSNRSVDTDWTVIFKNYKNAVVQIFSNVEEFNYLSPYLTGAISKKRGSGFLISDDGYIVTNYHVVSNAVSIEIQIPSIGKIKLNADLEGVCPNKDIALLKLTDESLKNLKKYLSTSNLPYLVFGDSDKLVEAEEIMIAGYPLGQENLKISRGQISGWEGQWVQTTAPINPGNSGGPCLNKYGEVIGIICMKAYDSEGIGYLIPINTFTHELKNLKENKVLHVPWVGLTCQRATEYLLKYLNAPIDGGVYIIEVQKESIAYKSGIQKGDILYSINECKLDYNGFINLDGRGSIFYYDYIVEHPVNSTLEIVIYRKGVKKKIQLFLDDKISPKIRSFYPCLDINPDYEIIGGLVLSELTFNHLSIILNGISKDVWFYEYVTNVLSYGNVDKGLEPRIVVLGDLENSEASKCGWINFGRIISKVNGVPVKTIDDFRSAVLKNYKNDCLIIESEEGNMAVLSIKEILKNEDSLAEKHLFTKSNLVKELENKRKSL
jgi:serine protease Do